MMSGAFAIRPLNVHLSPLDDLADVVVVSTATDSVVGAVREVQASRAVRISELNGGEVYKVKVFPHRHRPVARFERAPASGDKDVELVCPVDPGRVQSVRFPAFSELDPGLQLILGRSRLEDTEESGEDFYRALDDPQRAGLLNVYAKMNRTAFGDGTRVSQYVQALYRVRADRFFADVDIGLRDRVKSAVTSGLFDEVSGKLHAPPPGFAPAGSFKTGDAFGNLQLSFFSSGGPALAFKVDADIDDANGVLHVFQVLRNFITGRPTHPYDIHEVLIYSQKLDPGYNLVMTA